MQELTTVNIVRALIALPLTFLCSSSINAQVRPPAPTVGLIFEPPPPINVSQEWKSLCQEKPLRLVLDSPGPNRLKYFGFGNYKATAGDIVLVNGFLKDLTSVVSVKVLCDRNHVLLVFSEDFISSSSDLKSVEVGFDGKAFFFLRSH